MKILAIIIILIVTGCATTPNDEPLPLFRGDDCSKGDYPTNVNLRFESIPLLSSLQLLAGFSCNEVRYRDVTDVEISTNYTDVPWEQVVSEICDKNKLKCWTEVGNLYVLPLSQP